MYVYLKIDKTNFWRNLQTTEKMAEDLSLFLFYDDNNNKETYVHLFLLLLK